MFIGSNFLRKIFSNFLITAAEIRAKEENLFEIFFNELKYQSRTTRDFAKEKPNSNPMPTAKKTRGNREMLALPPTGGALADTEDRSDSTDQTYDDIDHINLRRIY